METKRTIPSWVGTLVGFVLMGLLALTARWLKVQAGSWVLPGDIPGRVLEFPLWAVAVGLVANGVLRLTGLYGHVEKGFSTEIFLKTGLVLLGAGINFMLLLTVAGGAVIQSLILVTVVYFFCWYLGGALGLAPTLRAVMASAVSVCGVSAAIAAAGAVQAKKQELTYISTLVIVVTLPLMVILPLVAQALGLSPSVAGAWFGGNIDTSAAVVGAATLYGEEAQKVAVIVKSSQNALLGFVALALSLYFATKVEGQKVDLGGSRGLGLVWQRFPKFVLGFIAMALLHTLGLIPAAASSGNPPTAGNALVGLKDWAFCLAFVGMGLQLRFKELGSLGWKPLVVYLGATVFNTFLALGVAWVIFGVILV